MRRIRSKLMLSLLVVTLIPLIPSYHLVRGMVDRSFDVALNENVAAAIAGATSMSRHLYARHRDETLRLARPLAASPHVHALLHAGRSSSSLEGLRAEADLLGEYALSVLDSSDLCVASIRALPDSLSRPESGEMPRLDLPDGNLGARIVEEVFSSLRMPDRGVPIEKHATRLSEWVTRTEPFVIGSGDGPEYVSVCLPIWDGGTRLGSVLLSRRTPDGFPDDAGRVMAVNQLFQTAEYYREEMRLILIGIFLFFYGTLAILAVGVGYFFSRRITSPLLRLVDGTRVVAGGNLDYSIEVQSRDEIGQLMESFNQMIDAIRENQRLAQEREQQRLQVAAESAQHEADLEVARLRTRALQAENEAKDLELKRGQQLAQAYEELEESHRQLQEAQAQLILQEKMASLGTMVAGFAHEINNPMGAVHGAADVARRCVGRLRTSAELDPESGRTMEILESNLAVIVDAEQRVTGLVASLRNFARLDEAEFQMVDLREGLESSLNLIGQQLTTRIQVHREYREIPKTFCAAAQINQVFLNVLRNAVQAIEGEGTISVGCGMEGQRIAVHISDTGSGIDPQLLERIFDLSFSAKSSRVKLGSGLSMAYRIVQEHSGDLRIDSTPGEGIQVSILLPVREAGES